MMRKYLKILFISFIFLPIFTNVKQKNNFKLKITLGPIEWYTPKSFPYFLVICLYLTFNQVFQTKRGKFKPNNYFKKEGGGG